MQASVRAVLASATALTAAAILTSQAWAQAAQPSPQPGTAGSGTTAATPATSAEKAPSQRVETIVVTGSRIRRDTFNTASPLTVITNENAVLSGTIDAVDILQGSTAAAGSSQINNFFSGFIVEGGPGIQTVGLNSLGSQRTLLLLNGRRLPPSGTRGQVGAVDLQTIPSLAISRYEILNEGASPIYGSDAVGGVVNAIVRTNVNGFEATATASSPTEGDGEQFVVGTVWGKTADRWNVMVSAQYVEQKALKIGSRDFCQTDYVFNADTGVRVDYIDPKTGQPKCYGVAGGGFNYVSLGGATGLTGQGTWVVDPTQTARTTGLNPSVTPVPGNPAACVTTAGVTVTCASAQVLLTVPGFRRLFSPRFGQTGLPVGAQIDYNSPFIASSDLISPSQRTNVYATGAIDLDILGGIEVYGEGLYAKRESEQIRGAQLFPTIPATNVYNPFGVLAQPVLSRPANADQTVDTWQVLLGVRGQTGNGIAGWFKNGRWDVYGQTSEGKGEYGGTAILQDRLNATLATTITGGVASCPTPALTGGTCLPINFFDPRIIRGEYTAAEYDYLFNGPNLGKTVYRQSVIEANVSGDLFEIPGAADSVKANLGFHYRKYDINDVPSIDSRRGNVAFSTSAGITKGKDSVKEFYGEIAAPLVAKKPLIENLELTAAYRYTDYDSYDSNTTWKATLDWRLTPQFRVVAISGTSYRAPSLFELFLGDQTGFLSQASIDPCRNWGQSSNQVLRDRCRADLVPEDYAATGSSATIITGGGEGNLKEEESRSDIFSFIYTPTLIDLNLRVDAWKIEVTDQVAQFGAGNIVSSCYTDTTGRAASFCPLFVRDKNPTSNRFNQILTVQNNYVNVNVTRVEGIDLKALYRKEFSFGNLSVNSQHRWTTKSETGLFSASVLTDDAGLIGEPIYNSTTQLQFRRKDWTYAWTIDAIGQTNQTTVNNPVTIAPGTFFAYTGASRLLYKTKTEAYITHDVSVQYRSDNWTLVGGISNIFNEEPPSISTGVFFARLGEYPLVSQYDLVGRSVFASITRRF
ncbi:colicin I receptor [Candidatus Phycosocius bacilliformis]|uniref:Colicin I receptor n=1 Tax=Candidatus Phycosocius bacilliformis TaxID=1445552 RepID=A0A2P2ECV2_9PROT|nr:TonB-dependent receptor [Candidatus Phycosocius bacilliformis]GBF58889.1 colicin I receptor [Candidatus Phycosocius bacilliformis]